MKTIDNTVTDAPEPFYKYGLLFPTAKKKPLEN